MLNIQQIILALTTPPQSHPCCQISGEKRRDYWFHSARGSHYQRVYEGDEDTEQRRNRGFFPLAQAQADAHDLFRGNEHKDRGIEMRWKTPEQCAAEAAAIEEARKFDEEQAIERRRIIEENEAMERKFREEREVLERGRTRIYTDAIPPEGRAPEKEHVGEPKAEPKPAPKPAPEESSPTPEPEAPARKPRAARGLPAAV